MNQNNANSRNQIRCNNVLLGSVKFYGLKTLPLNLVEQWSSDIVALHLQESSLHQKPDVENEKQIPSCMLGKENVPESSHLLNLTNHESEPTCTGIT